MLKASQFTQEEKYPDYTPSKAESTKTGFVMKRFSEMQQARTVVDKDRSIYQKMIDAIFTPYPDERSSSTVPLASSIIELYVSEALKIQTEFVFKAENYEYSANAKALEYVWKYDWRKNRRKKEFLENEYICAGFGTSVIYTGFEAYNKTQKDPIIGDDMTLTRKQINYKEEKIIVKNIDIRNFYIDNQAIQGIEDAVDCIYVQWISFERFKELSNSPLYRNIDKVTPSGYSNENVPFTMDEDDQKQGEFVKLTHYRNVEKDAYMVIANDVLVREHPMISTIDGKKALPFAVRVLGKKNYSIYGRGLCEGLMMFNSEINNLRELLLDGIRRSNTQVLAIGNGLSFDGRSFSYDNEILTFDGNLANNFQQLSGNPPNQAIFNYLDRLYKDIAVYVGIDINNIVGSPNKTAFEVEVQVEASQKRVNLWLTNRDLAYERFANLYKDLLQTYFPRKTAEGLYPKIEIEDEELKEGKGDKPARFRKKKGKNMFEVTPEILRGEIYIDVHTNTTQPSINAVEKQQKLDLMTTVGSIAQGYAVAKQSGFDMEKVLPLKQTLRDLASMYNLSPENDDDQEDVKEEKKKLMSELQGMMGGTQPPMGGAPVDTAPPEVLPPTEGQGPIQPPM